METLVVVDQHKNQYYNTRSNSQGHAPFRGINCRTFQSSGTGLLPKPSKSQGSPKTPSTKTHAVFSSPDSGNLRGKSAPKSTAPIAISGGKERTFGEDVVAGGNFLLSELWAGPTYSNSPPPSSLPIPKFFSVMPKRTVSLELPGYYYSPEIETRPAAKSAPASPSRDHSPSTRGFFGNNTDSATKTLCRILNLNINDE